MANMTLAISSQIFKEILEHAWRQFVESDILSRATNGRRFAESDYLYQATKTFDQKQFNSKKKQRKINRATKNTINLS